MPLKINSPDYIKENMKISEKFTYLPINLVKMIVKILKQHLWRNNF